MIGQIQHRKPTGIPLFVGGATVIRSPVGKWSASGPKATEFVGHPRTARCSRHGAVV